MRRANQCRKYLILLLKRDLYMCNGGLIIFFWSIQFSSQAMFCRTDKFTGRRGVISPTTFRTNFYNVLLSKFQKLDPKSSVQKLFTEYDERLEVNQFYLFTCVR